MERYKRKYLKETHTLKNVSDLKVDPKLNIGDKVFINDIGAYYEVAEKNKQKFYNYAGLVLPNGWDDNEVKVIK